ncbi:MAG: cache domain-containing protein [Desulfobacterales bacterium]|nr:cache domain-containing protein [Desulfobacterales bacterium]
MKNKLSLILVVTLLFSISLSYAEENCTKEDVVKAIDDSVAILEKEGEAGLEAVGKLRFCGDNYVFVNNFDGVTLMHMKPSLIGKNLIALKDDTGKRFFADFTDIAKSASIEIDGKTYFNGKGWASYRWPKPDEKTFSPKISYIRGCKMGEKNVYVGAGIYE